MLTLFLKEWKEQKWKMIIGVILLSNLFIWNHIFLVFNAFDEGELIFFSFFYVLIMTMDIVAGESDEGTLSFLFALPVSRKKLFFVKYFSGVFCLLGAVLGALVIIAILPLLKVFPYFSELHAYFNLNSFFLMLDFKKITLNFLTLFFIYNIFFMLSVFFNSVSHYAAVGLGILICIFLILAIRIGPYYRYKKLFSEFDFLIFLTAAGILVLVFSYIKFIRKGK